MIKKLSFQIIPSNEQQKEEVLDSLKNFNRSVLNITTDMQSSLPLNYNIQHEGKLIAGINANLYFLQSILHIDHLFVNENFRGNKLGSKLLQKVETDAKERKITLGHLDTFDFQALDFYLKHGYEIFGILDDCPKGHKRYYLKKVLK